MKTNYIFKSELSELTSKELGIEILKISALGLLVASMFIAPGLGPVFRMFDAESKAEKQRIRRAFQKMKQEKMIRCDSSGGYMLSSQGRKYLSEEAFFEITFKRPTSWSKKWFIVMFDIPNEKEYARTLLRNKLLQIGFIPYQHSVYVFPFECRSLIKNFEKYLHIEGCIQTMTVLKLDGEISLRKTFKL